MEYFGSSGLVYIIMSCSGWQKLSGRSSTITLIFFNKVDALIKSNTSHGRQVQDTLRKNDTFCHTACTLIIMICSKQAQTATRPIYLIDYFDFNIYLTSR